MLRVRHFLGRRTAAVLAVVGLLTMVLSVSLSSGEASALPSTSTTLTVHPDQSSGSLTPTTQGLSYEISALNDQPFVTGNLVQYLKTLGVGVLRLGGSAVDKSFWTSTGETPPSWATSTITPAAIDRLALVAHQSGWSVILSVNFQRLDAARAANEAAYAKSVLGSSLLAISPGNEPEQYYSNAALYNSNFNSYVAAIQAAAPGVQIFGSDIQRGGDLANGIVADQTSQRDIGAWLRHVYPTNACGTTRTSIGALLGTSAYNYIGTSAAGYVAQANQIGVPAMISETNTVACEGQQGVSDVFASALWSLTTGLQAAQAGVSSIDFHGSVSQCYTASPGYKYYTPLCANNAADFAAGRLTAQPEYYGLLALRQVQPGTFLKLDNSDLNHLRAFAVKNGSQMDLVLINVDNPTTTGSKNVTVNLGATYSTAKTMPLTSRDGLTGRDGIALGGRTVQPDGTIAAPLAGVKTINSSSLQLTVSAGSAMIIKLS